MQAWDYAPYPFVVFGLPMVFFPTGVLHVAFTHWAIADELERILRAGGDVAERPRAVRPRITGISPMGVTGVW